MNPSGHNKKILCLPFLFLLSLLIIPARGISSSLDTTLSQHLNQLKSKTPKGFTVILQSPFVVLGDDSPDRVQQYSTNIVKWAVDKLKADFFPKDPNEIIDIWLFQNESSYTTNAKQLFNDTPDTPFGYYSESHHALVMNISTGGGTLVHEIVHPFMKANFPKSPAWFNEGLASLYEQSAEKNGHIIGLTNWRLKGLQTNIKNKKTISFQKLTSLTDSEFYGLNSNSNYSDYYAQSRYLLYYLQEKNLLIPYYKMFSSNYKTDPTGYNSLQKILGTTNMSAFQSSWESYALSLHFP